MTYKIVRFYRDHPEKNRVVKKGLTLREAQKYCKNPETSSATCSPQRRDRCKYGAWFDGYMEEK